MEYVREVLDRQTGRLATVSLGNWITVSEMGERMGVGPRQTRNILRDMGVLQVETSGAQSHRRHRLCPWVVEREWGRRCERRHAVPFDTLSPSLQGWIEARWDETVSRLNKRGEGGEVGRARAAYEAFIGTGRNAERTARELACWLFDHFPRLSYGDVAAILSVTPQLVGRFAETRQKQRSAAIALKGGKAGRFDMMCSRGFPA